MKKLKGLIFGMAVALPLFFGIVRPVHADNGTERLTNHMQVSPASLILKSMLHHTQSAMKTTTQLSMHHLTIPRFLTGLLLILPLAISIQIRKLPLNTP